MENLDLDIRCDDFLFANTSSSVENVFENPCDKIPEAAETKTKVVQKTANTCDGAPTAFTISSSSSTLSSEVISQNYCAKKENIMRAPNLSYELAVAKTMMQQYSSISGDNLFDHLSDIIKRVIDERPPNVIDFFEEFSRSVREQKFHLPERFPADTVFEETRMFKVAKKQLISMKLPYPSELALKAEDDIDDEHSQLEELKLDLKPDPMARFFTFNSRVQHLQFFWNQCGFSVSSEDIFQLACSMNRLQTHPSILQCRFWGMINGLKASYYIVEASLSNIECESRLMQMKQEIQENLIGEHMESMENFEDIENVEYAKGGENAEHVKNAKREKLPSHIGPELTPGAIGWENTPEEELAKMKPKVLPVPLVKNVEVFDIPPEPIGKGVNRYSYFVVNSLFDDWIELPIVTPKQISLSREIKKFFTGDLEEDVVSYPCFCGKEKHYLRAMIARITAGTYIAPTDYYRKMTKKEKRLFEQNDEDDEDGEEEEDEEDDDLMGEEEQDEGKDNDIVLLKNEKYDSSIPLNNLKDPGKWVHVRPNILLQGRVVWYDQEKAEREREKERKKLEKSKLKGMGEEESESEDDEEENDEEGEEEEDIEVNAEIGPAILTSCSLDTHKETPVPWTARFTSKFTNQNERIMLMQSNIWPGACSFIYKDLCESIYLGWGHKTVARNMMWKHFTAVEEEYEHELGDFIETIDPSVEQEQAYHLSLMRKEFKIAHTDDFNEHDDEQLESTDENESEEEND